MIYSTLCWSYCRLSRQHRRGQRCVVGAFGLNCFFGALFAYSLCSRDHDLAFAGGVGYAGHGGKDTFWLSTAPARAHQPWRIGCHAVNNDDASSTGLWTPDAKVVDTIEEFGGRVTKSDVLSRGVPASGLERELLQLARASGAGLCVNEKGELLYDFPPNLKNALRTKGLYALVRRVWTRSAPWLKWAGRVAFGASLLATVAITYSAMLILISSSTSSRDDGEGKRSTILSQNHFTMWFGEDLFWWLSPRPYGYYNYYGDLYGMRRPKMSFLEAIFSFVFGDGDPNVQLIREDRWQLIGEVIVGNGGAVVAEQIVPYLDPPTDTYGDDETRKIQAMDRQMLPVLLRFRGKAEVTESGDIVYVFPELQESTAGRELIVSGVPTKQMKARLQSMGRETTAVDREGIIEDYLNVLAKVRSQQSASSTHLEEKQLKFSEANAEQQTSATIYGVLALVATLYIGTQLGTPKARMLAKMYPVIQFVMKAYPLLLAYTVGFLGIPAFRWLRLQSKNEAIQRRNSWRKQLAETLRKPDRLLRRRLKSATAWARSRASFGQPMYDSAAKSSPTTSADADLRRFDEKLLDR